MDYTVFIHSLQRIIICSCNSIPDSVSSIFCTRHVVASRTIEFYPLVVLGAATPVRDIHFETTGISI